MATKLGDLIISIGADIGALKAGLDSGRRMLDGFAGGLKSVVTNAAGVGLGMLGGDALRDLFHAPKEFVQDAVKMAAGYERAAVSLEVLTGNAQDAKDMLAGLREFGTKSGLGLESGLQESLKLLSAGVKAGQVLPTLDLLGELSMGDRGKFSRATLAYGQAKSTTILQGDELRQLNELGLPVMESLATALKVPVETVKGMVSDGKVQFRDLQMALKGLTDEGGKFHGLMARGAETTEGLFGRLDDAVGDLKRQFGAAVIEEVGLKDALKDGAKFAGDMKGFIDDLRPGIRFVGDTIKGVGQVVGELVRHGPLFGRALVESVRTASPHLADLIDKVQNGVRALQNFKLDPRAAVDWAMDLGLSLGETIETVLGSLGDGLATIYNDNVKPIVDELKAAALTWQGIKKAMAAPVNFGKDAGWQIGQAWEKNFGKGQPTEAEYLKGRREGDYKGVDDLVTKAYLMETLKGTEPGVTPDRAADVKARQESLLAAFADYVRRRDEVAVTQFRAKWNPSRENFDLVQTQILPDMEKAQLKSLQKLLAEMKLSGLDASGAVKLNGVPVEAARPEMAGPASAWKSSLETLRTNLKKMADDFAVRRDPAADPVKAGLSGLIGPVALLDLQAGGKKAREAFKLDDPTALKRPSEARLPNAAEYGSTQAAEMIARARSGQADGWQRLAEIEQQQLELLQKIEQSTRLAAQVKTPSMLPLADWGP